MKVSRPREQYSCSAEEPALDAYYIGTDSELGYPSFDMHDMHDMHIARPGSATRRIDGLHSMEPYVRDAMDVATGSGFGYLNSVIGKLGPAIRRTDGTDEASSYGTDSDIGGETVVTHCGDMGYWHAHNEINDKDYTDDAETAPGGMGGMRDDHSAGDMAPPCDMGEDIMGTGGMHRFAETALGGIGGTGGMGGTGAENSAGDIDSTCDMGGGINDMGDMVGASRAAGNIFGGCGDESKSHERILGGIIRGDIDSNFRDVALNDGPGEHEDEARNLESVDGDLRCVGVQGSAGDDLNSVGGSEVQANCFAARAALFSFAVEAAEVLCAMAFDKYDSFNSYEKRQVMCIALREDDYERGDESDEEVNTAEYDDDDVWAFLPARREWGRRRRPSCPVRGRRR